MATTTSTRARSARAEQHAGSGPRRGVVALLLAAALVCELVVAVAIVEERFRLLLLPLIAVGGFALVARFPTLAVGSLLVLAAGPFHDRWFDLPVPLLKPWDFVMGALLLLALVRPRRDTWGGAAGLWIAAFLALLVLSTALAITAGRLELAQGIAWTRPFFALTLFYVVVRLYPEPEAARRLLALGSAVGAATGLAAVLAGLGTPLAEILQDPENSVIRADEGLGVLNRARLPGLALSYALLWFSVVRAVGAQGGVRVWWWVAVALNALNILVSLNRNMWVGVVFGFALLVVLGGARVRHRLALGVGVSIAGFVVLGLMGTGLDKQSPLYPVIQRGATILSPSEVGQTDSATDRLRESRPALRTARENPIVGVGAGVPFGAFRQSYATDGELSIRQKQLYLHNQYLYLAVVGGIPLLLAWLLYLAAVLRAAWAQPRVPQLVAAGIGLGLIMLSATVEIYFSTDKWTAVFGLVGGAIVADRTARARRPAAGGMPPAAGGEDPSALPGGHPRAQLAV